MPKLSLAKRGGVSPHQQPGRGTGTGAGYGQQSPSFHHVTPPRSGLPGDTSGGGTGGQGDAGTGGTSAEPHRDVPRLRVGTMTCHGEKRTTPRDTQPVPAPKPPLDMVLPPRWVACLPPNTTQGGQKSHPVSPHPQGTPKVPLGRAHLEAAGVPVVPGTFGLFLLLCGGKAEGKSLQGSWGEAAAELPPAQPSHQHWTPVSPVRRPHRPASQELGTALSPRPPWGLGTPTLVLQGLQPLLGLVVQLLQVRGPRAGEEDVVGAFLGRRVLHAQPLLTLALGSACGDSGVSWAGGTRPRCHQCVPTHRG